MNAAMQEVSLGAPAPTVNKSVPDVETIIHPTMTVVDCGCYGWRLAARCEQAGASLIGVDQTEPLGKPLNALFAAITSGSIALPDDLADLVVASHVLEHVTAPVEFLRELLRITRPGGLIWIEVPSELSAQPAASDDAEDHSFGNFWDDPTHVRPWTPGALYRLAISCHCMPLAIGRCDAGSIAAVRLLGQKPPMAGGVPQPRYVSLRGVDPGVRNAWEHVWGRSPAIPMPLQGE